MQQFNDNYWRNSAFALVDEKTLFDLKNIKMLRRVMPESYNTEHTQCAKDHSGVGDNALLQELV